MDPLQLGMDPPREEYLCLQGEALKPRTEVLLRGDAYPYIPYPSDEPQHRTTRTLTFHFLFL
jgi:hypothetical protein